MTPDQLIEQCRLAIKWAESVKAGTPIEIEFTNGSTGWERTWQPVWNFENLEYREKPRPLEGYAVIVKGVSLLSLEDAKQAAAKCGGGTVVHMREVVE